MANGDAGVATEQAPQGQKKERSPSFPFIGLTKAIERAQAVFAQARRHEARVGDVAAAWGMGAKSSATLQTIAALLAYGLLEDQGSGEARKLRITDLAFKALEDRRPGAREAALAEAAIKPKLIAEYVEKWKEGRPADHICISELRIDRGFTEDGAKAFLRVFDDTVAFADRTNTDSILDKPEEGGRGALVKVGDAVQWTSGGVDQFGKPTVVAGISDDGQWLWVTDSTTGIPVNEVKVITPAISSPITNPIKTAPQMPAHIAAVYAGGGGQPAGYREEKFALAEGDVVIRFPEGLSSDSVEDLEAYLQVFLKKARRESGAKKLGDASG